MEQRRGALGNGMESLTAEERPWMSRPCSLSLTLPPLATIVLGYEGGENVAREDFQG